MGLNSLEQDLFCLAREDLEKYVLAFLSNSTFINSFDKTKFLLVCLFVSFCFSSNSHLLGHREITSRASDYSFQCRLRVFSKQMQVN